MILHSAFGYCCHNFGKWGCAFIFLVYLFFLKCQCYNNWRSRHQACVTVSQEFTAMLVTLHILLVTLFNRTQGAYLRKTKNKHEFKFAKLPELYLHFCNSLPIKNISHSYIQIAKNLAFSLFESSIATSLFQFCFYKTACHMCPIHNAWQC